MPRKKITEEEFFNRCFDKHGKKYDYSNIVYDGMASKLSGIICTIHKTTFSQLAHDHASGKSGCSECVKDARRKAFAIGVDEFRKRSFAKFGNKFDLSKVKYINKREKVKIICKIHGVISVSPEDFLANKYGCPKCGKKQAALNGHGYYTIYKAADRFFIGCGILYLIRLYSNCEEFLKIGVTTNKKRRFSDFKKYGYCVESIFTDEYHDLNDAIIAEFFLHNEFRYCRIKPQKYFPGFGECFLISKKDKIVNRLQHNDL